MQLICICFICSIPWLQEKPVKSMQPTAATIDGSHNPFSLNSLWINQAANDWTVQREWTKTPIYNTFN